jgi:membrane peptidoglycan carboxypeptidase
MTEEAMAFLNDVPSELTQMKMAEASKIYSSDGHLVATFFAENRTIVPLDEVSDNLKNAVVSIEDQRFWEHGGIDLQGTIRAAVRNAGGGDSQSGGSGITQQYVKNILIDKANQEGNPFGVLKARESTLARKAREAKLSMTIAEKMPKEEILEGYLNVAQFGSSVYGAEAAANYYFSKHASELNVVEAATIAGVTKNPSRFDPSRHPRAAQERRDAVLYKMWTLGYITDDEYEKAIHLDVEQTLNITPVPNGCMPAKGAGFFCDFIVKTVMQNPEFGETPADRANYLYRGGLQIYSTMDWDYQQAAERAMERNIPAVNSAKLASSLIAMEPGTGKIRAMVQSTKYNTLPNPEPGETAVNYATDFSRGGSRGFQPGSNFKPFVLTQWLREGHKLSDMVSSAGRTWTSGDFRSSCLRASIQPWTPGNAEGGGGGMMTAADALKQSVNTAFVHIESKLDLCGIKQTAWDMGYRPTQAADGTPFMEPTVDDIIVSPNMVLGTQQTAPMYMASGYSTIAAQGVQCDPIAIERVLDTNGKEIPVPSANCKQGIEENVARTMAYAMRGALEQGGTAYASRVKDCRPTSGKTGTSNLGSNTWFTGYFPNLLASVWVGDKDGKNVSHMSINFEGRAIHPLYGSSLAAPLWKDFMDQIIDGIPVVDFPEPDPELTGGVQVLKNPGAPCTAKQPGDPGTLGAHPGMDPFTGLTADDAAAKKAGVLTAIREDPAAAAEAGVSAGDAEEGEGVRVTADADEDERDPEVSEEDAEPVEAPADLEEEPVRG